jgi:signal transduction histidine kinase/ActR/RegA family two-component response regulator
VRLVGAPAVKAFDWVDFLRHHPILSSLDEAHLLWLVGEDVSIERTYVPGAVIFREGDEGGSVFLIGAGSVEAVLEDGRGQTIPLSLMQVGDTFGEMAFFEDRPRSATVRAREACVVLEIEREALRRLVDARPDVELEVLLTVSERLRGKNEQLLELHLKAVEAANRAKDEFFAMLGHELRNPLAVISAAVDVLNTSHHHDTGAGHLGEIIARQTHHLSRLVDDLLDVSRLAAGKLTLERRSEDLRALVQRTIASFREVGRASRHVISLTGEPLSVDGDPTRLEQIVTNLLDNAVKYTPPGGRIDVSIAREGGDALLRVRDTGVGISPDALPRIFDPFVRANGTSGRPEGGLGLGLTLVKRLVELHGGTVGVASAGPDRGSEVLVRLPRAPLEGTASEPSARDGTERARRVLIVDDNPDVREVLRLLLETWGHQVDEAETGERGLELIQLSRPDVVLVDLGLPDLDGCSLARAVRSAPEASATLLVAITGYGGAADRRRTSEAGFDAHLTKPFDADELARILVAERRRTLQP